MAARRRSSARRSGGSPRAGARSRVQRKHDERDGKTRVACPACGSEYRVPESLLDQKLRCKSCGRQFFPNAASSRGLRKSSTNLTTPFIMGGGILVFCVVAAIIASSGGSSEASRKSEPVAEPVVLTGLDNPRARDVADWLDALATGNTFKLTNLTDHAAMRERLGMDSIDGTALEVKERVVAELLSSPETELLRRCKVYSGELSREDAGANQGLVHVYLSVVDEFRKLYRGNVDSVELAVAFDVDDHRTKVAGWTVIAAPKKREPRKPRYVVHEQIGVAKDVEREFAGEVRVVREAELVGLPHLESAPEAIRKEVDDLIEQLIDIDAPGGTEFRASRRLKAIGRPSIPRLLNKMFETKMDSQENVLRLRRITMALEDMTGLRFGFNPSPIDDAKSAANDEQRLSALRQWYGWWADNHTGPYDYAIDKEDTLEIDDKKPPSSASKK